VIERLVVTSEEEDIYIENGYFRENDVISTEEPSLPVAAAPGKLRDVLARVEEDCIRAAMDAAGGRVARAASLLGVHRSVLYRKLQAMQTTERPVADERQEMLQTHDGL
jgi:DNA-binding NtrC family response regulator